MYVRKCHPIWLKLLYSNSVNSSHVMLYFTVFTSVLGMVSARQIPKI